MRRVGGASLREASLSEGWRSRLATQRHGAWLGGVLRRTALRISMLDRCLVRRCCLSWSPSREGLLKLSIVVVVVIVVFEIIELFKVDLVAQDAANTTEALNKLVTLG